MIFTTVLTPSSGSNPCPEDWEIDIDENEIELATNSEAEFNSITQWLTSLGVKFLSNNDWMKTIDAEYWQVFVPVAQMPPKALKALFNKYPPVKGSALDALEAWVSIPF